MLKRLMLSLTIAAGLLLLAPAPEADASNWGWNKRKQNRHWVKKWRKWRGKRSVPELDPSAAGSALVLLVGGVAYIASRKREEDELA